MKKNRSRNTALALLFSLTGGLALIGATQIAAAQTITAPDPTKSVSPEVAKPVQEAQKLAQDKNYTEALAKLNGITKSPLTSYESYVIDRSRLGIASVAGDEKTVDEMLPRVIDSSEVPKDEKLKLIQSAAGTADKRGDYKGALAWTQRYLKEGGDDPRMHSELVRYYYLSEDYTHAGQELKLDLDAAEKAGQAPSELQLRLLISIAIKQNDKQGLNAALEKTVAYYPKKENWLNLLQTMRSRPNFPERLAADFYRLKNHLGLLEAREYAFFVDSDLRAGYATEAKKVLDAGYAAKTIGDDTPDIKQLMGQATKDAAGEARSIAQTEADVRKNKDGLGLVNVGYSYVTLGQLDKGLEMMEQGVKAGNLKRPEEAKLHLGMAYAMAGQKEKAVEILKNVQGTDGTADLARYWILSLNSPMH
jgi:hypothetical protein